MGTQHALGSAYRWLLLGRLFLPLLLCSYSGTPSSIRSGSYAFLVWWCVRRAAVLLVVYYSSYYYCTHQVAAWHDWCTS